ncbi:malyl-CoA thiolesterase [Sphingomonas sp. Leaf17]|uniref:HpcH/HpaI aldolase/citrate lyase family protein n=1 Tax=Sphingomonas sp. Leaf17 TaxID=1735683 RepID=UPI0006F6E948|nr:CoA ester lyase [Sphingomonas sp. Leaf17]KQM67749.1 malyl-CoA thiolesterase [Sphingomonas sp. Leaf17]
MTAFFRHRSALFMPASNPRAIAKARTLPCDIVILDLEDAVAPDQKAQARTAARAAIADGGFGDRPVVLRVNALDTEWSFEDLDAARTSGVDAVLVPKATPAALRDARAALGPDGPPLWAMIETCGAMLDLRDIVRAAPTLNLTTLVAGTNDLAKDMRCRPDAARTPLLPALAAIVTAARAGGLVALDGVCNAIDDADRLAAECRQGADFGCDGKTLIHPAQIAAANAAFAPDAATLDWATRVVAAFDNPATANRGAIRLDGAMVERLHLDEARRILASATE